MVTTLLETRQSEERAGKCRANLRSVRAVTRPPAGAPAKAERAVNQSRNSHENRSRGDATARSRGVANVRSEEHTSELQSRLHLVCRLLLEKKKKEIINR